MIEYTVSIGTRIIGRGLPVYIIAEIGTTALGDYNGAIALIQAAAKAGCDAVKFQLIDPDQISDKSVTYPVMVDGVIEHVNMYEMFQRLRFSEREWKGIAERCNSFGLEFFATVDFIDGVDLLDRIGVNVHKIGAWDCNYRQLIEKIGRTGKPMFVDLGPTTESEVSDLVGWYTAAGGSAVLFMHDFHTQLDMQMNMRAIQLLNQIYPWPAGFSSPAQDEALDIAAVALGACYIEKRLTLDRTQASFHAHESLEPEELIAWVNTIRHVERALGRAEILPSDVDLEGKLKYYRSICTLAPLKSGERFTEQNLGAKRPGTGIPTARFGEFLGRVASRDLPADTLLKEGDYK
jgi:sialic acid synthase SpsE